MPLKEVVETLRPYMPLCEKLGKLMTRIVHGAIGEIELEIFGEISEHDTSLLTVAFLKGFLEDISTDAVTYANAPMLALERGITVTESKSRQSKDYVNMILATASSDGGKVTAGATLVGKNQEMFVNVLDFDIEIAPVSYTHLRAHETRHDLVCRLLLEKKKKTKTNKQK